MTSQRRQSVGVLLKPHCSERPSRWVPKRYVNSRRAPGRPGSARRALLTVRRLLALFVTAIEQGDARLIDDTADAAAVVGGPHLAVG